MSGLLANLVFVLRKSFRVGVPATLVMMTVIWFPLWFMGVELASYPMLKWVVGVITFAPIPIAAIPMFANWDEHAYYCERQKIAIAIDRVREHRFKHKQLKAAPPKAGSEPPTIYEE